MSDQHGPCGAVDSERTGAVIPGIGRIVVPDDVTPRESLLFAMILIDSFRLTPTGVRKQITKFGLWRFILPGTGITELGDK